MRLDTQRLLAERYRGAVPRNTPGRTAGPDRNVCKAEAARDNAHNLRRESSPTALGPDCRFLDMELTV